MNNQEAVNPPVGGSNVIPSKKFLSVNVNINITDTETFEEFVEQAKQTIGELTEDNRQLQEENDRLKQQLNNYQEFVRRLEAIPNFIINANKEIEILNNKKT